MLDISSRADVNLAGKHISHRHQSFQCVNQLTRFHLVHALEEKLARHRRAGKAKSFEQSNLAAIKIEFACHGGNFATNAALSSRYLPSRPRASARSQSHSAASL